MKRKITKPTKVKFVQYYVTFEDGHNYYVSGTSLWAIRQKIHKYFPSAPTDFIEVEND